MTGGIDALLLLQRSDVIHLAADPTRWAGVPMLCIDPGTLDAALQAGFTQGQMRRLDLDPDLPARVYAEALTRASALDQALTRERRVLLASNSATPFSGWDQMLLYLSLQRAFMARALGESIAAQWPNERLGLLRPDNAQMMNFDGLLSTEMAAVDPQRFTVVGHYSGVRFYDRNMSALAWHTESLKQMAQAEGGVDGVAHIATCFYDAQAFAQQIRAAHPRLLDLPGTYCDIALMPRRPAFMRVADAPAHTFDGAPLRYAERARAVYREQLAPWMPSRAALDAQCALWAERSQQQALNHLGLLRALEGQRPRFIVADHDTGQLGPIFSAAAALDAPSRCCLIRAIARRCCLMRGASPPLSRPASAPPRAACWASRCPCGRCVIAPCPSRSRATPRGASACCSTPCKARASARSTCRRWLISSAGWMRCATPTASSCRCG